MHTCIVNFRFVPRYTTMGKLKPDMNRGDLLEKRAKADRVKLFSKNLRMINQVHIYLYREREREYRDGVRVNPMYTYRHIERERSIIEKQAKAGRVKLFSKNLRMINQVHIYVYICI